LSWVASTVKIDGGNVANPTLKIFDRLLNIGHQLHFLMCRFFSEWGVT